jgi:hypothetical protein
MELSFNDKFSRDGRNSLGTGEQSRTDHLREIFASVENRKPRVLQKKDMIKKAH